MCASALSFLDGKICAIQEPSIIIIIINLSLNGEGRWGTKDDFATSFLHFSLFFTALWDLANSRPVYYLMLSSMNWDNTVVKKTNQMLIIH